MVTDIDFGGNDDVDEITIPIPRNLQADGQQTPLRTYTGRCGRANLEARISIISECPANMYGPQCTVECVEQPDKVGRSATILGRPPALETMWGQPAVCVGQVFKSQVALRALQTITLLESVSARHETTRVATLPVTQSLEKGYVSKVSSTQRETALIQVSHNKTYFSRSCSKH